MKGACQAYGYNYYKCNNPEEQRQPCGALGSQPIDLRKYYNRNDLNSTADSGYLNDAAERNEAKENYYVCKFKVRRRRKCKKQCVVAANDDCPLDAGVYQ